VCYKFICRITCTLLGIRPVVLNNIVLLVLFPETLCRTYCCTVVDFMVVNYQRVFMPQQVLIERNSWEWNCEACPRHALRSFLWLHQTLKFVIVMVLASKAPKLFSNLLSTPLNHEIKSAVPFSEGLFLSSSSPCSYQKGEK
jgi:hypothetical protein